MDADIVILPGDGIGPEVSRAATNVLEAVAGRYQHRFHTQEHLIGGCAIDAHGAALPDETLAACQNADAVFLGAVGGPKWDDPAAKVRPEQGLLGLRKAMGLYANLRPVKTLPISALISPVRPERLQGVDMLVVRELTGGIYFGEPRLRRQVNSEIQAVDTMSYTESEIERVARLAFDLARTRRKKVTSIDKANVLECSRLWREVVSGVAEDYPDITLEHILVDAAAMFLISRPADFDIIVTANMFGDILTDEASVLAGSMGLLPSASLGESLNRAGFPRGLYEPIHGSAPDIAGKNIANPAGAILSMAMLLRHSLGLEQEAIAVESAVSQVLDSGVVTVDLAAEGMPHVHTLAFSDRVVELVS